MSNNYRFTESAVVAFDGQTPIVGFNPRRRTLIFTQNVFATVCCYHIRPMASRFFGIIPFLDVQTWVVLDYAAYGDLVCSEWYCHSGGITLRLTVTEVFISDR